MYRDYVITRVMNPVMRLNFPSPFFGFWFWLRFGFLLFIFYYFPPCIVTYLHFFFLFFFFDLLPPLLSTPLPPPSLLSLSSLFCFSTLHLLTYSSPSTSDLNPVLLSFFHKHPHHLHFATLRSPASPHCVALERKFGI
jgi:hypothetical protein